MILQRIYSKPNARIRWIHWPLGPPDVSRGHCARISAGIIHPSATSTHFIIQTGSSAFKGWKSEEIFRSAFFELIHASGLSIEKRFIRRGHFGSHRFFFWTCLEFLRKFYRTISEINWICKYKVDFNHLMLQVHPYTNIMCTIRHREINKYHNQFQSILTLLQIIRIKVVQSSNKKKLPTSCKT